MRWIVVFAVVAVVATACSPTDVVEPVPTNAPAETTTTRAASEEICLSGDLPFGNDGLIAALGDEAGDATSVSQLRWDPSSNCERVTIVFGTVSGAPASMLGPSAVTVIPFGGIVRAVLPQEVTVSSIADTLVEGSLVDSVYVVRDDDGTIFVDVHAVEEVAIEARAFTTTSPATLIIDVVRADTDASPAGVTTSPSVVIISPIPGATTYPITVSGYVEPALLSAHVLLLSEGTTVVDHSVSVGGYTDTWQTLSVVIEDGPVGTSVLFVGSLDSNRQPLDGAQVSVNPTEP